MLTGPLYVLQIYYRVFGSRPEANFIAFSLVVAFLYSVMGILDFTRGQIIERVGARFHEQIGLAHFCSVMRKSAIVQTEQTATGLRDQQYSALELEEWTRALQKTVEDGDQGPCI